MLSDKIFRLKLAPHMHPRFFVAALNSRALREQIEQALSGGNGLANNLPQSSLLRFVLCVPPEEEQRDICAHLDRETSRIDALISEVVRATELLLERRASLISAAVTGKIDVRNAIALPEEVA
ncbi:hypothetical protein CY658_06470 [Variovorax sp. RO1]|nr:hypothetical protein CY658_06470 [Variovorax sp. RO1]